ncbi:hypothetical protein CANMA_002785 [Candida margitis]|uniref:uncharacterized protein n=1 Tax=Candida margitis TaxID=1775924 RepID=UPI002227218D|nr:uncharacterized protein CANMA_002785 [Candida margitis]KAI5968017.1 hypothetical protein CANMA_002785 [Candida margitis]
MMSSNQRSRRAVPSTLNTPTAVNVNAVSNISQEQAEQLLTQFIEASEHNRNPLNLKDQDQNTGFSSNSETIAVASQLKRIQRNLRGLPPLSSVEAPETVNNSEEAS